jgi:hypothetical protein
VPVVHGATYTVMFDMRAPVPKTGVKVFLCSKLLLYSADCHVLFLTVGQADVSQHVSAPLPAPIQRGRVPAPVELAFATGAGVILDLADVQLVGPDRRPEGSPEASNIMANGDFAAGTARWFFTSDDHWLWRILDSPLSIWFEGGVVGTAAVTLLVVSALGGAAQAIRRGEPIGAPIGGAMLAVLLCGFFDNIFEAPRIALLFDLVAMLGLMLGWPPRAVAPPRDVVSPRDVSPPRDVAAPPAVAAPRDGASPRDVSPPRDVAAPPAVAARWRLATRYRSAARCRSAGTKLMAHRSMRRPR